MAGAPSMWAEEAIERACRHAQDWYRSVTPFERRVNLGSVVGYRSPALLSEHDCVLVFVRFLVEAGVPWEAIHNEVSISRWMFDDSHPAATAVAGTRRRVDLVLIRPEELLAAALPTPAGGLSFDAFLEFGYLTDYWREPKARVFNKDPLGGRQKVEADVDKIAAHLNAGACKAGYVIVFEECDYGFEAEFAAEAENKASCRVRFIRGW